MRVKPEPLDKWMRDQLRAVGREETLKERVGGSADAASRSERGGGGASSGSKSSA